MFVSHRVGRNTSVGMRIPALAAGGLAAWMLPFALAWWSVRVSVVVIYWTLRVCWLMTAMAITGCTTLAHHYTQRHAARS